ncbi:hypothetical protein [Rhodococcus jostii]|uniref:hypothetical protein n=1 Tax=Rhodococcus jostii TaxID=132919 RepID=UPI003631D7C6
MSEIIEAPTFTSVCREIRDVAAWMGVCLSGRKVKAIAAYVLPQRQLEWDGEQARAMTYSDVTGEEAVRRVMAFVSRELAA